MAGGRETGQYLTFQLGRDVFGVDIREVREIIQFVAPTPIPMTPDFILGVMNLRGEVVPVIDLARRFGLESTQVKRRSCTIVMEPREGGRLRHLGIIVDSVYEVRDVDAADIEPAPSFGADIRLDFIAGMARLDGRFVILLAADKALSFEEMVLLAEACAEGEG
ncbi:chemotaxis protein CheW [Paludibacterium paludis]|uniref:Chemotaxis protein CheW n=2 Tax=Paludibacterium paludis TaxID=1225769 RepID=A0A918P1R3_9NEIS|nr:chemotaxis protein CheW [Paludibacterium paludis]